MGCHPLIPAALTTCSRLFQWDVLAVSCYGSLDGGIPRQRHGEDDEEADAVMAENSAASASPPKGTGTAAKSGGGDTKEGGGGGPADGLVLLEGGARLGALLLGIIRGVLFEVRGNRSARDADRQRG